MRYKRIAVISYHTCPLSDVEEREVGGMNVYVLELCRQLASKGYVIDIYTRSVDKKRQKIVNVCENLRVIHIVGGKEKNIEKEKLANLIPGFLKNLYRFIDESKIAYDLIYSHYYLSGIIGLQMKERYGLPLFVTFHTLAIMKNLVARDELEREDMKRIESELLLTRKADKIIATSESDAGYLFTLYNCPKAKIAVIMPGVDLRVFRPKDKKKSKEIIGTDKNFKLILFVGRIEPLKGIDVLLYAVKVLIENNPQLKLCLWILGGDISGKSQKWSKELRRLEDLRKLLNISAAVTFVGRKNRRELPDYYNASEIIILPSHYESFGIVALEAMACGVPVITTDTTGIAGFFNSKYPSLITSSNNPLLLSEKIKHLLINESEYGKLRHDVLRDAASLTWEKIANKFVNLLEF